MNGQIYLLLLQERRRLVQAVTEQIKILTRKQLL